MTRTFAPTWHLQTATLVAVLGLCVTSSSWASIISPEPLQFDEKQLLTSEDGDSMSGGSNSADHGSPSHPDRQSDQEDSDSLLLAQLLSAELPTRSSSGSSSSSGPSGSSGTSGLMAAKLSIVVGDDCVERVAGERALFLPDAPGSDLFHPPRDGRS